MKLYAAHLDFTAIIDEFRLDPAFPPDVLADAATATDQHAAGRVDATHDGRPVRRRVLWTWKVREGLAYSVNVNDLGEAPPG